VTRVTLGTVSKRLNERFRHSGGLGIGLNALVLRHFWRLGLFYGLILEFAVLVSAKFFRDLRLLCLYPFGSGTGAKAENDQSLAMIAGAVFCRATAHILFGRGPFAIGNPLVAMTAGLVADLTILFSRPARYFGFHLKTAVGPGLASHVVEPLVPIAPHVDQATIDN
jgi:hypothetical protein